MDKINYYNVPSDKIGFILSHLSSNGWEFNLVGVGGIPIEKGYIQATSRNWDGHECVFKIEQWKDYKFIAITSNLLMKFNSQTDKVYSFAELKVRVGLT